MIERGERRVTVLREAALATFAQWPEARVEYFEITDPDTLQPVELDRRAGTGCRRNVAWVDSFDR